MGGILALFPAVLMTLADMAFASETDHCRPVYDVERFMAVNGYDPYLSGDDQQGRRITVWVDKKMPSAIITFYNDESDESLCYLSIIDNANFNEGL